VKNNKKRITVECLKKQDTGCAWRFHALMITHNTIFATKTFNPVHTYSGDMGTDGHRRASRKFVASILQNILLHRPTCRACDVENILLLNLECRSSTTRFGGKGIGAKRALWTGKTL